MLTRPDDVNKIDYWAYRLDEAIKADNLQYAVYLCNKTSWNKIWAEHKRIIEKIIPKGANVLDAGCAYGRMSELFEEKYTGVDFAPSLIAKAKELYPSKTFFVASLDNLSFSDKEFDWAICASIRQMIQGKSSSEHWLRMEKELKRVADKILILEYTDYEYFEII